MRYITGYLKGVYLGVCLAVVLAFALAPMLIASIYFNTEAGLFLGMICSFINIGGICHSHITVEEGKE